MIVINKKDINNLEFELSIKGVPEKEAPVVRFLIVTEAMMMAFPCVSDGDNIYIAPIPALDMLDINTPPYFLIEVIVGDYYFEALRGDVSVVEVDPLKPEQPIVTLRDTVKQMPSAVKPTKPKAKPKSVVKKATTITKTNGGVKTKANLNEKTIQRPIKMQEQLEGIVEKLMAPSEDVPAPEFDMSRQQKIQEVVTEFRIEKDRREQETALLRSIQENTPDNIQDVANRIIEGTSVNKKEQTDILNHEKKRAEFDERVKNILRDLS